MANSNLKESHHVKEFIENRNKLLSELPDVDSPPDTVISDSFEELPYLDSLCTLDLITNHNNDNGENVYIDSQSIPNLNLARPTDSEDIPNIADQTPELFDDASNETGENESICAICLSSIAACSVTTPCNHTYCSVCLMTYWNHHRQLSGMKCPTCRTNVSTLSLVIPPETSEQRHPNQAEHIEAVEGYNLRFSSRPKPLKQHVKNWILLIGFCVCEFFSVRGLIWMFWMRLFIVFFSLFIGFLSVLEIWSDWSQKIIELTDIVDQIYLTLLLLIYSCILIRRHFEDDD